MEPPRRLVITNLQALRAFAAAGVVFYHTAFVIPGAIHTDFSGVMIFFVISGFIMTYITRSNAEGFLTNRLIRIVPLYWIATVFVFAYGGLGFENPTYTFPLWGHMLAASPVWLANWFSNQASALCTGEAAARLFTSMLFIPTVAQPRLGVGWTLNIEVFFYVVFWLSLKVSRRYAPAIACATLIAFKVTPLRDLGPLGALYAHPYTTGFIFGVGVYYAWMLFESWKMRVHRFIVYAAVAVSWVIFFIYSFTGSPHLPFSHADLILPAAIVFGGLALHSIGVRITSSWLLLLGEASYALYLFHINVLETMHSASADFPCLDARHSAFAVVLAVLVSCLLAVGIHVAIERPLLRTLRRRVMALPPTASPSVRALEASTHGDAGEAVSAPPAGRFHRWPSLLHSHWPTLLIFVVMLPSLWWISSDRHVWPWDQAWYGEVSVDLWYKFSRHLSQWGPALLAAFGSKSPGIAWLGQCFVPFGRAFGSIETGLLCSIVAAQIGSIALFYGIAKEFAPERRVVAAVGILLFAGAPLFVAMSHQYFAEPLQLFGVTYFYFLAATGHKLPRLTLLGHLLLATSIALLAKMTSPIYCGLPGVIAAYALFQKRPPKSEPSAKTAWREWAWLLAGVILCAACAAWYVKNLPALRAALQQQTSLEFTANYGRPGTFFEKVSYWLTAMQASFQLRWVIVGQLLLVGAGAALARIESGRTPRETGPWRFHLLALSSVIHILGVLALCSTNYNEENRYMLPLLPAIATVNIWLVCRVREPWLLAGIILLLCFQWVAVCSQALGWGDLDRRSCSYWLIPFDSSRRSAKELTRIVRQTSTADTHLRYNIVGVELPWLNANSLAFFAAKQQLKTRSRCFYTSLGYGAKDLDLAWKRMNDMNAQYFISLEEAAQPANPNFVNLVSSAALQRIRVDPDFVAEPYESKLGVVIFRKNPGNARTPAPVPPGQ